MKNVFLLVITGFCFTTSLFAQEAPKREIGLRISDFSSIGMIYKKELRENTYRRYRLALGNLSANFNRNTTLLSFAVGGAIGKEKRRNINDKFQFVYGTELITAVNLYSSNRGTLTLDNGNGGTTTYSGSSLLVVAPSVGIGLVLGAQYNVNSRWYVSAELIPSITASGAFSKESSIYSINASFNSSNAGITGAYRF